jgi:outer membrane protein
MTKMPFLIGLLLLTSYPTYAEETISLNESFSKALKNNQIENINDAKINQYDEQVSSAKSSYYPKLYLKGTYTKQENLNNTHYANLYLTHSLFKGGKDLITTSLAENSKEIALQTKNVEKLNLYINVINAYYNFFLYDNDAKNLELLTKQSSERMNEIQKRVAIGRSRYGELLQAKAQLAQAEAQYSNAKGLLSEAEQKFRALTGVSESRPAVDLNTKLKSYQFNSIFSKAQTRPDVLARELKIEEASQNISFYRRSHLPTVDLTSNYYLTKRTGTSYTKTDWDASIVLTFPLFEGFGTNAKVSENVWKEHEARYNLIDLKKTVELDLSSKFETHNRYMNQIESFDQARELAKKSYDEALKDYRLGLISNLDVLTALNLYLDAKRNTEKNIIQAIMSEKILEATTGEMP